LSKAVGYLIIVFAAIVKVPQLIRLVQNWSTHGLVFFSVLAELVMNLVNVSYGVSQGTAFSLYGENVGLAIQNVMVAGLMLAIGMDSGSRGRNWAMLAAVGGIGVVLLTPGLTPALVLNNAMAIQSGMLVMSRVPQIMSNFRLKSTGNLAMLPFVMAFVGNVMRMLTILKESRDQAFLAASFVPILLNGTIVTQFILYYRNVTDKVKAQ
jgi:mannose-P-dolichol utilization defect protein 1